MAYIKYSVDRGGTYESVLTTSGSSTTYGLEITYDNSKMTDKKSLLLALQAIINNITRRDFQ